MKALTVLVFAFLFAISIFASETDAETASRIAGVQQITATVGIVHTKTRLYRTVDGGATWNVLGLDGGTIAGVKFADARNGWAVVYDRLSEQLVLANTKDGGYSWETRSAAASIFGEDTYFDKATLHIAGKNITATFRIPTSSNFEGRVVFRTDDGGLTWMPVERVIEKRTSDDPQPLISRNWTVTTDGSCANLKRGCYQESSVVTQQGRDITPSEIRQAAAAARFDAERQVATELFLLPPNGSVRTSLNRGFDKCTAGTIAQMQTWWNASPLYDANIYISGRNRGCSQAQLNANWVNQVSAMGWGLIPTIVGYQSPCIASTTFNGARFSLDPAVAETQGRTEADIAVTDAANLGLTAGSILYYDMERYDETGATPGCRVASTAFLKGWTERVRELGYRSGTYGSPRNAIDDWQFMPAASRMEAVWMARWDNIPSVWTYLTFANFPTNVWNNHQRIKQWQGPHDETWGGVTFNIDGNIADGPVAGVAIAKNKNADFDGDRKADISVFRPDNGVWYVLNSSNGSFSFTNFGLSTDIATPGDYDGDGKTDYAVFRPSDGVWHMQMKAGTYTARQWGTNGDIPVAADYNGDGKTDLAVFRPSNGTWYIANSDSLGTSTYANWGIAGDKPVVGDYDGDGKADIAVFRPSNGAWYILRSSDGGFNIVNFGLNGDRPAQGYFDDDNRTDIAVYRPSNGTWYIYRSSDGGVSYANWGIAEDVPVTGDYDGDNKDDVAVFRPSNGVWYVLRSSGGFTATNWGLASDAPVPNAYLPR